MKPFYITTSIAYPNANPHVGYAMELVQADFLARYMRLSGQDTFFLTGLDEHGLKIKKSAEAASITSQQFVDEKAIVYQCLIRDFEVTPDRFIRTSDADHLIMAQALWKACEKKGDIYKKGYRAWYNIKEEEFLGSLDEFPDPSVFGIDSRFIEKIEEENYFFALSKYKDFITDLLKKGIIQVKPQSRLNELLSFINEKGLQDVSISREKSKLDWGLAVPGDDNQVMYVWFDALSNYLTAIGKVDGQGIISTDQFWPASLHCIGKDISRFHVFLWPAMLQSAGLAMPVSFLIHGFITSAGQKMSKSIGNVIDPFELLKSYPADVLRWYLLKETPTSEDGDFTHERLNQVYLADLANDYGNLVSRVWTMVQKYSAGKVPEVTPDQIANLEQIIVEEKWREYKEAVAGYDIQAALQTAHQLIVFCNRRIEEYKPWQMAKDPERSADLQELLYELLEIIRHFALMTAPVMPAVTDQVAALIFPHLDPLYWSSFEHGAKWGMLPVGQELGKNPLILFPKDVNHD